MAGNGQQGYADGEGAAARFNFPTDVVVDKEGTILVVDRDNNRMRRLTGRHVTTLAGGSEAGTADGAGPGARFTMPNRWRWTSAGACSSPNMDGGTRCGWWRRRSRRRRALQCAGGAERVLSRAAAVGDAGGEGAAGDPDGGGERAGVPGGAALSVHGGVAGVGGASGPGDERRGGWIGGGRERRTLERRRRAARRTRRWDAQRWSSRY